MSGDRLFYSNCSDYLYIYSLEAYKKRNELALFNLRNPRRLDYYSVGYVNPLDMVQEVLKRIRRDAAVMVEYDPLNWPFDPDREEWDAPDRLPEGMTWEDYDAIDAVGFPPLYAEEPLLREVIARIKQGLKLTEGIPGPRLVYETYYRLYRAARSLHLRGAGLVTSLSGIVPPSKRGRRKTILVIAKSSEGQVCTRWYDRMSWAKLRERIEAMLREVARECRSRE